MFCVVGLLFLFGLVGIGDGGNLHLCVFVRLGHVGGQGCVVDVDLFGIVFLGVGFVVFVVLLDVARDEPVGVGSGDEACVPVGHVHGEDGVGDVCAACSFEHECDVDVSVVLEGER